MIRTLLTTAALATLALSAGPAASREKLSGDQQLAKLLEGRVAGKPTSCVNTFTNRETMIVDHTALVLGHGKTIWVNVPSNPRDLDNDDTLITHQFGTQLCRQDIVRTVDRYSGFPTGAVFLSDFVPYTRAD
jgi:hypothetical protein